MEPPKPEREKAERTMGNRYDLVRRRIRWIRKAWQIRAEQPVEINTTGIEKSSRINTLMSPAAQHIVSLAIDSLQVERQKKVRRTPSSDTVAIHAVDRKCGACQVREVQDTQSSAQDERVVALAAEVAPQELDQEGRLLREQEQISACSDEK